MATVKRVYDGSGRRAQAELNRVAILDAAGDLFLSAGYAATAIPDVAATAGVSVELVYKRFGGRPGLARAVVERALEGAGPVPAEQRSDALSTTDARDLVRQWGQLTAEVAPRVAPMLLLVRAAAAHDPEMIALATELDASRRSRMTANARRLHKTGQLRAGVTVKIAADVLWTYSSPELFELLVLRSKWPIARYAAFVADGITAQVF
ncbi:MAG: putative transcriptional regulator, TetR family protein [Myxococcales bacterium]|nr:putative transcriptional regulator, TetR family protein [Myxococcales bacterium]